MKINYKRSRKYFIITNTLIVGNFDVISDSFSVVEIFTNGNNSKRSIIYLFILILKYN
jgi:hypothetical protein